MMHIGRLAQQAGTTTRTVRYYEEMGLIEPEGRSPGGFRCYSEEQLKRLRMILSLKEMEFDLEQIKTILDKRSNCCTGGRLAASILEDLNSRLDEVNRQIKHFQSLRSTLRQNIASLCSCLPCELRLEDRLCDNCDVLHEDVQKPLPFFHTIQVN
ncbi:MAG: MerR family transcriptional regulator [bacterium]|nr:MerR family transcriptional regulator [bacterium]